jgi:tripartite-type tricarboxylate transporter receptor subunit TctC
MQLARRRLLHLAAGAAALPGLARIARARGYPTRPVRIIVPLPPGSAPDIQARIYAEQLGKLWGAGAIVVNRAGGGGTIGTQALLSARRMAIHCFTRCLPYPLYFQHRGTGPALT